MFPASTQVKSTRKRFPMLMNVWRPPGVLRVPLIVVPVSAVSAGLIGVHSPIVEDCSQHRNLILSKSFAYRRELLGTPGVGADNHDYAVRQPPQNPRIRIEHERWSIDQN